MSKNKRDQGANACPLRKTSIGGQALMEGIMMRGPKMTAMAVRNTQGEVVIEKFPTESKPRPKILKLPIIRGVAGFVDSMSLGYKCLMRSAEISGLEEIEEEMAKEKAEKKALKAAEAAAKKGTASAEQLAFIEDAKKRAAEKKALEAAELAQKKGTATAEQLALMEKAKAEAEAAREKAKTTASEAAAEGAENVPPDGKKPQTAKKDKKEGEDSIFMNLFMAISMILAVGLMLLLFFWLPSFLYKDVMEAHIPGFPQNNRFLQSIFGALIRLALLIGYMSLMLLMKDIRRTFQYHGAEHKTIFCYEHGMELTVENVRRERRFHPRCGTSFLIIMVLVGILVGFLIPADINKWVLTAIKIAIVPLVMGIGYELIKICGKYDNWLTRIIAAPGQWFQRITVLEPDDGMIECAIAAMKEVIPEDGSDQI